MAAGRHYNSAAGGVKWSRRRQRHAPQFEGLSTLAKWMMIYDDCVTRKWQQLERSNNAIEQTQSQRDDIVCTAVALKVGAAAHRGAIRGR